GISHEAIALAGHLKLSKLIVLFDDNGISIDGPLSLADSVDQVKRFEAAGWATARIDGHDPAAIAAAIATAKTSDRPTLVACKTKAGAGPRPRAAPKRAPASPPGGGETRGARPAPGWPHPPFEAPADIRAMWRDVSARGKSERQDWAKRIAALPSEKRS